MTSVPVRARAAALRYPETVTPTAASAAPLTRAAAAQSESLRVTCGCRPPGDFRNDHLQRRHSSSSGSGATSNANVNTSNVATSRRGR